MNIISWGKVVFCNFGFYFIVTVYIYSSTIDVAYLAWFTEIYWYLSCDIITDINQCAYPRKVTWNLFQSVPTNHFPSYSYVYQYKHWSTWYNTTILDLSVAYLYYIEIWHCECLNPDSSIIQLVSSSGKKNPYLVMPYIDFFSLNGLPK